MNWTKNLLFTGIAVVAALLAAACSGPAKPANEEASPANTQPAQDPKVQIIELPAPKGAKPGQKIHAVITPYSPGNQGTKDADALKDSTQPKQP